MDESSGETDTERWATPRAPRGIRGAARPRHGRKLSAEDTVAAPGQVGARHANEESGGTSEGRGHNQRAGPGGGQALGPSRSRPRGETPRNQLYVQSADGTHHGRGPGEHFHRGTGGHIVTLNPHSAQGLQSFKGQEMKGKTGKKIDPLSSLSRQERCGPKSAPRKGPTRKRPSSNGNRSRTAHGGEAELGRPLMDWGASRLTREGGAIRLAILNRKRLRDSPSRPGSVSVGTAPGRRGRRGQVRAAARCCPWSGAEESGVQAAPE